MSFTVFSFNGEHPIVYSETRASPNFRPDGVGLHVQSGNPSPLPAGTLIDVDGNELAHQEVELDDVKQLAKDEVMRLYEEQVYGVESKPTDLVLEEWKQKEVVAERYLSGQLPANLLGGYRLALISALTTTEIADFTSRTPALIPGTDDDAIATELAEKIVGAATAKRVLLCFAGAQRRNANDVIDATPDYPTLASALMFIKTEVPVRTAQFLAQFGST